MDNAGILKRLRTLMAKIEANGCDEKCETLVDQLSFAIENYESIDKHMVDTLHSLFNDDTLTKKDQYEDVIKSVENGSIVVYFKSAQLFKVYKKEDLLSLLDGQLRTAYKHLSQSYEVVPNEAEQKIIIMGDISLVDKIDHIKTYIIKFMLDKGIEAFKEDDIICFKNTNSGMVEIIINNYYVKNFSERNEVVQDLLKYIIRCEKNQDVASKLNMIPDCSAFDNANIISMPSEKQLLNENTRFIEMIDRLVHKTDTCTKLVKEGNIYNIYIQNAEVINNADTIIMNDSGSVQSGIDEFLSHIKRENPDWYKPSTFIEKRLILEAFEDMYQKTPHNFYGSIKDRLYSIEKRSTINKKRVYMVKLFKLNNIV